MRIYCVLKMKLNAVLFQKLQNPVFYMLKQVELYQAQIKYKMTYIWNSQSTLTKTMYSTQFNHQPVQTLVYMYLLTIAQIFTDEFCLLLTHFFSVFVLPVSPWNKLFVCKTLRRTALFWVRSKASMWVWICHQQLCYH